jgi:phosphonate transport system substrate-binding protein
MRRLGFFLVLFFFLYLPPFISFPHAFAGEGHVLVFGRVHDDPVRSIRDRQEFVDYIAKKLAPVGITGGKIMVVEKMHLLAQALKDGKVDLFHDSVAPTLVISRAAGSIPILRQWKYDEANYEGIIVVNKKSGINSLADLKGKVIAFDEPHSTSASILPQMLLAEKKFKLMETKLHGTIKPDSIGYMYGADGSSVNVLVTGRADAAATIYREIDRLKPEIRDNLKVIGQTMAAPRQLLSIRKGLDAKIATELKELLINMDKDPEGQGVLKRQQNTTKFDAIPPESLVQMKQIEKYVFSSLGKEVGSW